ncbi:SusE domain-containing protein [Mucilaginibacter sp. AW1-7]|uniref:SusE domain-containing protein n=1 Tax=unclassified Mucilaginibacter TaxID=2617802 RepID=UPI0023659865|nr:SusE domain-containing protein [Mucilaginibacter sp. KACC 22773]WDF76741.1 SusE domain-containing protein [Mucilaginibacter sp. KACC 22773]
MKKIINLTFAAMAFMTVACHKQAELTTLKPVAFTGNMTASTTTVTLSATTDDQSVITFTWPAVVYPYKSHVTYTLQADLPADTVGATAWQNATSVLIGTDVLTKTYKGSDLNTLALALGVTPNEVGKMVFRMQAYQDRNTYSKAVTLTISPYKIILPPSNNYPVLYLPGDYQGWSPGTAGTVAASVPNIYEGYIYEPAGGSYHFKFTSAPDWNHINYGDGGPGLLTTDGTKGDLVLPGPGVYELVANPQTLTWSYTLVTWGIIGDATPGGWSTDTQMTYDPAKQVWTVTANMVASGSFKFRANNQWAIDFGITADGKIQYADNPALPYNGSLGNLTVPSNGNYTITLDLHDPNNYNFKLKKN